MSKKLLRTRKDNVLAGVCGGIARYLGIDVVIVRIIWVISALMGGFGLGTYIICAIVIPKERSQYNRIDSDRDDESSLFNKEDDEYYHEDDDELYQDDERNEKTKQYLGIAFILMGAIFTFRIMFPNFTFKFFWPVLLIAGGLLLLNRDNNSDEEE